MAGAVTTYPAGAGVHGFDTDHKLTAKEAQQIQAAGFRFAVRYLSRKDKPPESDLTAAEVDLIFDSGLALMAVQHVSKKGWTPSAELGKTYGQNAAAHATAVGLPPSTSVWLDLEGVSADVAEKQIVAYCNAWFAKVEGAGFTTGIYVGANCRLDGNTLFYNLRTQRYWKSGSDVPDIPHRGYCMVQTIKKNDEVAGVGICRDVTLLDTFGNSPILAARASHMSVAALVEAVADSPDDEATLRSLASTVGLSGPMDYLIEFRNRYGSPMSARYWAIVDFNLHSRNRRLFLFDVRSGTVQSYLCAHGKGSDPNHDGIATKFSNVTGSNCSSLGVYKCAETYDGIHDFSMRLDGLQSTNSEARSRAVVMHSADYVSEAWLGKYGKLGRSDGCFVLDKRFITEVIGALTGGSLLLGWHKDLSEADTSVESPMAFVDKNADAVWSELELPAHTVAMRANERSSAVSLAQKILESDQIVLARVHPETPADNAVAYQNIVDTAAGREAHRSGRPAPGGTVQLQSDMLSGILILAKEFQKLSISEFCGGVHSANSRHYAGCAVDIVSIGNRAVDAHHPDLRRFKDRCRELGATEVLGPGDPNHNHHVHAAWPRP